MFFDLHTHTRYSNHGIGHPNDSVQKAIELGLDCIGLSEHFPLPEGFTEPHEALGSANMHWDQIDTYIQEVRDAQEKFGYRIKILLGFEVDYLPSHHQMMQSNLAKYSVDYHIGSVHMMDRFRSGTENWLIDYTAPMFEEGIQEHRGIENVYRRYYELVRDFAKVHNHAIIGHIDLIKKFNQDNRFFDANSPYYLSQLEATLDTIKETGKVVEVNTAGLFKDVAEAYPSQKALHMILHRRIPICLSSDAHNPEHIARQFSPTWQYLQSLGFKKLAPIEQIENF